MAKRGPRLAALFSTLCCMGLAQGAPGSSLFWRLGGTDGMKGFVREALDLAVSDESARVQLASYICARTGGDCNEARAPQLSEAQFVQLVEALRVSMRAHEVPLAARNELLEALAPLRGT